MVYSVIIPFKGNIRLLERLLRSIPCREDVEVIVIDNGTEKPAGGYLLTRQDVAVICSDRTKGAGHARNAGLETAKGKWILFADADDFFLPDAFTEFDRWKDSEAGIVYFNVESVDSDTLLPAGRNRHIRSLIGTYFSSGRKNTGVLRYKYLVPWGKMIKSELIREYRIAFEEVPVYNDVMFSLKAGHYASQVEASATSVYCVTESAGSIDHRKSKAFLLVRYQVQIRKSLFLKDAGMDCYQTPFLAYYWFSALRYGPAYLLGFVRLAVKNKIGFFTGWRNFRSVYNSFRYKNKRRKSLS